MCNFSEYPGLYAKANGFLRNEGIKPEMPGYELLKRAIVICNVEGEMPKEKLLEKVKEGMVIPSNRSLKKERDEAEQWMIEAIKSVGIDIELEEFIKQLSDEL